MGNIYKTFDVLHHLDQPHLKLHVAVVLVTKLKSIPCRRFNYEKLISVVFFKRLCIPFLSFVELCVLFVHTFCSLHLRRRQ